MTPSDDFRRLHAEGVLVLPNAWDAASARLVERAGAAAVATTSGAVAWSLGVPDGDRLPLELLAGAVERIAAAVAVPVTADVESGGPDVAETVRAVLAAGAVGINIEDGGGAVELHRDRVAAAREAGGGTCSSTPASTSTCSASVTPRVARPRRSPAPASTRRPARTGSSCPG